MRLEKKKAKLNSVEAYYVCACNYAACSCYCSCISEARFSAPSLTNANANYIPVTYGAAEKAQAASGY